MTKSLPGFGKLQQNNFMNLNYLVYIRTILAFLFLINRVKNSIVGAIVCKGNRININERKLICRAIQNG